MRKVYRWSDTLAYTVGLLASDGNLSSDGRHINLTSKDVEQLENFKKCLSLETKIGVKGGGFSSGEYYYIQFSDVALYDFLIRIGLTPKKSLTLGSLKIPKRYFFSFLRGSLDGDGCCYAYFDKRWKSSYMIYLQFSSASKEHLIWINGMIENLLDLKGRIKEGNRALNLTFAKKSSIMLIKSMYKNKNCIALSRKREKILKFMKQAGVLELVDRHD